MGEARFGRPLSHYELTLPRPPVALRSWWHAGRLV